MSGDASKIPHFRARAAAQDLIVLVGDDVYGTDMIATFVKTGEIVPGLGDTIAFIIVRQGITLADSLSALSDLMRYINAHGVREAMPGDDKWDLH